MVELFAMQGWLATATNPVTVLILGVIFCAVVVRAAFGFGDVLVSVPILVLFVDPRLVIPLMGLVGATNALLLLLRERTAVQWHPVRFLLMASVVGVPIGAWLLTHQPCVGPGVGWILYLELVGPFDAKTAVSILGVPIWFWCRADGRSCHSNRTANCGLQHDPRLGT